MADYQVVKLDDVEDWRALPGEMRGITYAIGAEQVAITHRRMPAHGQQGLIRAPAQDPGGDRPSSLGGKHQFIRHDGIVELGQARGDQDLPPVRGGASGTTRPKMPEDRDRLNGGIDYPMGDTGELSRTSGQKREATTGRSGEQERGAR